MIREKIAVLGAGMVGRTIALDLAKNFNVTVFDIHPPNLALLQGRSSAIRCRVEDLREYHNYGDILDGFEFVVSAVPGFMGFLALKALIENKKNVADISFFPEDAMELDNLAVENDVTVITDIGVAPGMGNLFLGRINRWARVDSFECYVGGLPRIRKKPFEYKAPFSPVDVIEEYHRPARFMENGHVVVRPALSDPEFMFFDGVGTLEVFNTDGLRSLLTTMKHIPNMKEKTMRYPGHIALISALKDCGFFDKDVISVNTLGNTVMVSPMDVTAKILFKEWKLGEDEEELTVMRVIIKHEHGTTTWEMLDHYDKATRTSSMSRTTGYTCAAAMSAIVTGHFADRGVFPPELVGADHDVFDYIMDYLTNRGVIWRETKDFQ